MSAFSKELVRTITRKPGRFLALLAIVALGAGFYAGLRMTAPDMDIALDRYLDDTRVYDVRVVSTMGLEEADLQAIGQLEGVEAVMGAYQADVLGLFGEMTYTTRVHSLPVAAQNSICEEGSKVESDDEAYLNRLILVEGRWPQGEGECVLSADRVLSQGIQIGSTITFTQGTGKLGDTFSVRSYTVVGKVHMPYYVSSAAIDSSSLGSGVVQQVMYVDADSFAESYPYTDAFVKVEGADGAFNGSEEYDEIVDEVEARIEGISEERCLARRDSIENSLYDNLTTYQGLLDLAEFRLSHTKAEIDDPEMPEWLIMDRSKNVGMASFIADADRVDHIASIFPLMFFLVAALVSLTTMTRMVDEERQLIGTYKALGYTRAKITWKYAAYVLLAACIGSAVGIAVLTRVLPGVIMNAYQIMYSVPTASFPINVRIAALSAGVVIGITLVATWASATATLREKPASLMLPRAPKAGKRTLIEHVTPLWSRLSFTWKVTCRNIFRYKKRLIMTVIGIAGCTALLLTGLGLHDAINDIIDIQYGEIINYNALITLEDGLDDDERADLDVALEETGAIQSMTPAFTETMLASGPRAHDKRIDVVVTQDPEAFAQMKLLRTRKGHETLDIDECGVMLNEKMAQELGIGVGDIISVSEQDVMGNATSTVYEFQVGALCENYIYNYHYVSQSEYERVVGKPAPMNALYANVVEDADARTRLDEALDESGVVKTLTYVNEVIDTY